MPHVQPHEIKAALESGKPVWSYALGRFGRIERVEGAGLVFGRGGRKGRGKRWCTTFHRQEGDDCVIVETEDRWIIKNVFPDGWGFGGKPLP